jgi:deoxyadenosine/deoxycytidine kinase
MNIGERPRFIAIEGPIGVGKTTLARRLAEHFDYEMLEERADENPFLARFYRERGRYALQTQLFFLLQRAGQLRALRDGGPVEGLVADFLIDKDSLFAEVTLESDELELYRQVYQQLTIDAPRPDLVVYLQASEEVLLERIRRRGITAEQVIDRPYLTALNDAYARLFHYYEQAPLLIVNAGALDYAHRDDHFRQLLEHLSRIEHGRHYFNPSV